MGMLPCQSDTSDNAENESIEHSEIANSLNESDIIVCDIKDEKIEKVGNVDDEENIGNSNDKENMSPDENEEVENENDVKPGKKKNKKRRKHAKKKPKETIAAPILVTEVDTT